MKMTDRTREWVDALRFGEYEKIQGREALITDDGKSYCALGVGYKVLGLVFERGFVRDWTSACAALGLHAQDRAYVISLNDGTPGFSFESIADVIEYAAKQGTSIRRAAKDVLGVELR